MTTTETTQTTNGFRVVCPDGAVRHEDFETVGEALTWADRGHFCLAGHKVVSVVAGESVGVR